jgi:hypothetical protein
MRINRNLGNIHFTVNSFYKLICPSTVIVLKYKHNEEAGRILVSIS